MPLWGSRSSSPSRSRPIRPPPCNESDLTDRLQRARAGTLEGTAEVDLRERDGRQPGRASQGAFQGIPFRLEGPFPRGLRAEAGPFSTGRGGDQRAQGRAGLDAEVPAKGPEALRE